VDCHKGGIGRACQGYYASSIPQNLDIFKFNETISLQVNCETQEEVDYFWQKLSEGGDGKAQQCGWLK
jgi:predicted 3-demethylubiquinone-9 3-methyltransferase (glyoxalase superfamily)